MKAPPPADGIASVERAINAFRAGRMVIVVDDADRENEGDFVLAAEHVSPAAINFMATFGRGLICTPMRTETLDALEIPPAVAHNTDSKGTAFRVAVDHARLTTTGISATDRANTIRALIDPASKPTDFTRPGHVFPLGYTEGGVLVRPGHTEASVDLAELSGLTPAAVICEICSADGDMARLPELLEIGRTHGLPVLTIADLIAYRRRELCRVKRAGEARLPLAAGTFRAVGFVDGAGREHVALVMGSPDTGPVPLVSIHAESMLSDVFGRGRDDLERSLCHIARHGNGALIYLRAPTTAGVNAATPGRSLSVLDERVAAEILANLCSRDVHMLPVDEQPIVGLIEAPEPRQDAARQIQHSTIDGPVTSRQPASAAVAPGRRPAGTHAVRAAAMEQDRSLRKVVDA